MADARARIARDAADALEAAPAPCALVGFDGFIDRIHRVVDVRRSMEPGDVQPLRTIPALASRIAAAAGRSTNLELVGTERRWGGNGPLLAGALAALGARVTFVGAVGKRDRPHELDPIYGPLARACERVVPIASPGRTDALEFDDGKIMLNQTAPVQEATWARAAAAMGPELDRLAERADLVAVTNWSLVGGVEEAWARLGERMRRGRLFVDLSDPAKRTDADVARAMGVLRAVPVRVTLGLNLAEADRVARCVGVSLAAATGDALAHDVARLRDALDLDCVVVHPREGAAAASASGACAWFDGPLTTRPALSTGAGDHFNAGFALAQTLGLDLAPALAVGTATSGAYVRDGEAPQRSRLLAFLRDLPRPEAAP